jgi:hypothetical protein
VAIELVLMMRRALHLAPRQAEGFARSVLRPLGQELRVPDHTTLSRCSRNFAKRRPEVVPHRGPMHLAAGTSGPKPIGQGEWGGEKHGRARRSWRKLRAAADAGTGEIVACVLTGDGARGAGRVPAPLGQVGRETLPA